MIAMLQQHDPIAATRASRRTESGETPVERSGRIVRLEKRQYATLRDGRGWIVHALSGSLWITQDWDARDIVLEAGQSFAIDRPGTAVISAMEQSQLCVAPEAVPCGGAKRAAEPRSARVFPSASSIPA